MNKSGFHGFLVMTAVLATGCVIDPSDVGSAEHEIGRGDDGFPDPGPIQLCESTPNCSNTAYIIPYINDLQRQLNCGTTRRYVSGGQAGFLGGLGSLCPDSPSIRTILRNSFRRGWVAPYCNDCINVPAGKIFVFWTEWSGPGCTSGCEPMPFPGNF
jgi:hypothetical protein